MHRESLDFSRRIPELDGLRGLAILLVLFYHYIESSPVLPGFLSVAGRLTWSGVDLFFVLSGFLIGGILLNARESPNYFKAFYVRRAYRILPIYAATLAAFWLIRAFEPRRIWRQCLFAVALLAAIPLFLCDAYGVYLFHKPVLGLCHAVTRGTLPVITDFSTLAITFCSLLLTMILAKLSWVYFERPLIGLGHRHRYVSSTTNSFMNAGPPEQLPGVGFQ